MRPAAPYGPSARPHRFQAALAQTAGIPESNVFLFATHTHYGPILSPMDAIRHGTKPVTEYIDCVLQGLEDGVVTVLASLAPVTLHIGTGTCGFSASRRLPEPDGSVSWKPTLEAAHDHTVPAMIIRNEEQEVEATLFGYACHPTSAGVITLIDGGYPGFAARHLEKHFSGSHSFFIQGCGGDQKPFCADPKTGNFRNASLEEIEQFGIQLAESVKHLVAQGETKELHGALSAGSNSITISTQPIRSEDLALWKTSEHEYVQVWIKHFEKRLKEQDSVATHVPFIIQALCIGRELALIGLSAEATAGYGIRMRAQFESRFNTIWPAGYIGCGIGYISTKDQVPRGGYEVWDHNQMLLRSGPFVPETEDQIFSAIGKMLDESHST